jgi:nucleotide-binding universal stress UspA family protein
LVNAEYATLTGELDDADAWASLTGKLNGLAESMRKGKDKGAEYEQAVRDAKREVIDFGLNARSYVPAELLATIGVEIDEGKLAAAMRRLSNIRINATVVARGGAGYGGRFQSFDAGGVVQGPRGSAQLVEAHAGETILPTHKTGNAGGGRAVNVTVNAGMGANGAQIGREVVEAIRQYERSAGSGWRS